MLAMSPYTGLHFSSLSDILAKIKRCMLLITDICFS